MRLAAQTRIVVRAVAFGMLFFALFAVTGFALEYAYGGDQLGAGEGVSASSTMDEAAASSNMNELTVAEGPTLATQSEPKFVSTRRC